MKTSCPQPAKSAHSAHLTEPLKKLFLFLLFIVLAILAFAGKGPKLDFRNPVLVSGVAGADGAIYRFSDVDKEIDALF